MNGLNPQCVTPPNGLFANQRRSRLDICFELLEVVWAKEEIKPTQLMYKANLSWRMLSETLNYLSERDLVNFHAAGSRRTVALTQKGKACLQRLHEARSALIPEPETVVGEFGQVQRVLPSTVSHPIDGDSGQSAMRV